MKTRINLYLSQSTGEAFKRYCQAHRMSYSEVMERIIYRYLIQSKAPHSDSSLTTIQNEIHSEAVQAYRNVYTTHRQEVIETAIPDSEADVSDVSPTIPMPYPTTEANHHGTRTRTPRLSKREERR